MNVGILYSGGKDSTYATYIAKQGGHKIACLITLVPKSIGSYLFHYPNADKVYLQAEVMGIPLLTVETDGVKEEEIHNLRQILGQAVDSYKIEGIFTGGIASKYQKERFEKVCQEFHINCFNPLWNKNPEEYLREIIRNDFQVMITGVSALGFDRSWLGKIIDSKIVDELGDLHRRFGVNPAFEGGEGETFVTDCPLFKKRIKVIESEVHWMKDSGYLQIKSVQFIPKSFPAYLNRIV